VACLLNLLFEQERHTRDALEKFRARIKHRKTVLYAIDIAVYTIYAASLVIAAINSNMSRVFNVIDWTLTVWAVTMVNFFAMRHINWFVYSLGLSDI